MKEPQLIRGLSFDPNTKETGVAYSENERIIRTSVISAKNRHDMANKIRNYILENNAIEWVSVEGYYHSKNVDTTVKIGHLVMCVQDAAWFIDMPCFTGSTAVINQACDFPANMTRDRRKGANMDLAARLGFPDVTQDEADAIAVSVWGWGEWKDYAAKNS